MIVYLPRLIILWLTTTGLGMSGQEMAPLEDSNLGDDRIDFIIAEAEETNNEGFAVYLDEVPLEDYNPNLPTDRKDGTYESGKVEDGVWHWDFVPKEEKTIEQEPDFSYRDTMGSDKGLTSDNWV